MWVGTILYSFENVFGNKENEFDKEKEIFFLNNMQHVFVSFLFWKEKKLIFCFINVHRTFCLFVKTTGSVTLHLL